MERYPGSQEPRNTTKSHRTANLTQEIYWEGKNQEDGCLCLGEKQQQTEQDTGLVTQLHGKGVELFRVEIGGISRPEIGLLTL